METRSRWPYITKDTLAIVAIVGILITLLIPSILVVREDTRNRAGEETKAKLYMQWEKTNDPSFVLEFTEGGHLLITDSQNEHQTEYFVEGKCIGVRVRNLVGSDDCPRYVKREGYSDRYKWTAQLFTMEVLPSGELLIINSEGPYAEEAIVAKIAGRYNPLGVVITQTPSHIESRLVNVRQKDEDIVSQLITLVLDRNKLVARLRSAGVKSSSDLQRIPFAQPLASELTELVQQISSAEKRHTDYTVIIDQLESAQRRFKRREDLAETELSKEDAEEISTILVEVDEKLTKLLDDELVQDLDIEAVLEQELKRTKPY